MIPLPRNAGTAATALLAVHFLSLTLTIVGGAHWSLVAAGHGAIPPLWLATIFFLAAVWQMVAIVVEADAPTVDRSQHQHHSVRFSSHPPISIAAPQMRKPTSQ